jgi:hypothetical protein
MADYVFTSTRLTRLICRRRVSAGPVRKQRSGMGSTACQYHAGRLIIAIPKREN